MKIDLTKEPEQNCTYWDECQVNDCPLARQPNSYETLEADKLLWNYHKCRALKRTRMKIAEAYKLSNLGLTKREIQSRNRSIALKQQYLFLQGTKGQTLLNSTLKTDNSAGDTPK